VIHLLRAIASSLRRSGLAGYVDEAVGKEVTGWAWQIDEPDRCVSLEILVDGEVVGSAVANQFRQDLADAGKGDGLHGFKVLLPDTMLDGRYHVIRPIRWY
jgi:hypothetical protein